MKKNIIFGVGKRGKRYLHTLQRENICIDYFCDNNPESWNQKIEGITVISPTVLKEQYQDANVLIANRFHTEEIREQLKNMGITSMEEIAEMIFWNKRIDTIEYVEQTRIEVSDKPYLTFLVLCRSEEEISQETFQGIVGQRVQMPYEIIKWCGEEIAVHGEKILVLLNGSKLQKDSFRELAETEKLKDGIVGSKTIDRRGRIGQAGYVVCQDGSIEYYGHGKKVIEPEYEYVRYCDALSLNGLFLDEKYVETLFRYLLKYNSYLECAVAFAMEIRKNDKDIVFQPFSIVTEPECDIREVLVAAELLEACKKYATDIGKQGDTLFWQANRRDYDCYTLVADTTIARYDTNAGNRSTYNYIQMFLELNMWMIYVVDDFEYDYHYVPHFQKQGIFVVYGEKWKNHMESRMAEVLPHIEYAFLNRPRVAAKYVDFIRRNSDAVIAHYGHDLHYMRLEREYKVTKDEKLLEESAYYKEMEYGLIPRVDIIGYPSMVEVELLQKEFPTARIENFPLYFYDAQLQELSEDGREGILFVGGFGHRPNEDAAVWLVKEILPELRKQGITDKVYLVGSNPTDKVQDLQGEDIIVTGYVTDEELEEYYSRCFVDILPLRYGAGMKGKLLEAMYHGIPVVTTDIGAEGLKSVEEVIGVGNTVEEIVKDVVALYENKGRLKTKMEAEQQYMLEHFSKETMKTIVKNHLALRKKCKDRS